MKKIILAATVFLFIAACKGKKTDEEKKSEDITPVLPFLLSQAAQVDSSLFAIKKIEIKDSLHVDTMTLHRSEFRALAKDFLEIPDISLKKYKDQYAESQNYYDDLKLVSLVTLPKKPSEADIQKQEVLITPDSEGGKMKTIIIDREWVNKDSSVTKKMLWEVDKYFQVVTIKQIAGQPETIHTLKVVWNDFINKE